MLYFLQVSAKSFTSCSCCLSEIICLTNLGPKYKSHLCLVTNPQPLLSHNPSSDGVNMSFSQVQLQAQRLVIDKPWKKNRNRFVSSVQVSINSG